MHGSKNPKGSYNEMFLTEKNSMNNVIGLTKNGKLSLNRFLISCLILFCLPGNSYAREQISGNIGLQYQLFQNSPGVTGQHQNNVSLSAQPEYYRNWDKGDQSMTVSAFMRQDQHDPERSHFDIRELSWIKASNDWELRVGIRRVFWGVTESQHLVDIINQTDTVENLDGEDKLGQPMINVAFIRDWGTIDFYLLPYFRERPYLSQQSRLSLPFFVDQDNARYESSDKEKHLDLAMRWEHTIDDWDIAISHFSGTSREPSLTMINSSTFIPQYNLIEQTGLELQAILDDWILKLEVISREELNQRHTALTGGFENTLVGIFDSNMDLGVLAEYLFDDRNNNFSTAFANDLLIGTRLVWNNAQSTELLAGVIIDLDNQGRLYNLEASRRFGNSWKLNIEAKLFSNLDSNDPLYSFRQEDHIQAELAWYF